MSAPRRTKRAVSGWLVLNKPYDMTSTQAVGKLRWLLGAAKAGHAGTLDPLATGILPIAFGEATKTVPYVQDGTKIYRFTVQWGTSTTTDDSEGTVLETSDHRPSADEVEAILPRYIGVITQTPPIFSALKIDGERAYDLARAGEIPVMTPREIEVDTLILLNHGTERSEFEVTCGKGTYVRAIARDIAIDLGTRGHVVALHRAAVGPFNDGNAVTIDMLEATDEAGRDAMLLPVSAGLFDLPEIRLSPDQASAVRHGNPVLLTGAGAPIALPDAWASTAGKALAVGHVEMGQFKPSRVLAI